jgi:hypothetical protein
MNVRSRQLAAALFALLAPPPAFSAPCLGDDGSPIVLHSIKSNPKKEGADMICSVPGASRKRFWGQGLGTIGKNDGPDISVVNWRDCCIHHDRAYWVGGDRADKDKADTDLLNCMLAKAKDPSLGELNKFGTELLSHLFYSVLSESMKRWGHGRGMDAIGHLDQVSHKACLEASPDYQSLVAEADAVTMHELGLWAIHEIEAKGSCEGISLRSLWP